MTSVTKAQRETAIALLRKGRSARSAALDPEVGVNPTTVRRWAQEEGIALEFPYNRHKDRDDLVDLKEILRLYRRKLNGKRLFLLKEIADLCGCSESYVKQVCAQARKDGHL